MNHETSYRPEWSSKLGGTVVAAKKGKKKKKSMMDMSTMKMGKAGGKGK
jgi:hypothetical protein